MTEISMDCGLSISTFPTRVYFIISKNCQIECDYCYIKAKKNGHVLRYENIIRMIDYFSDKNCEIRITGGEPTIHPQFIDIINYCLAKQLKYSIQTNGLWSDSILNYFLKIKNIHLIVSPKFHLQDNRLNKTLNDIRRLREENRYAFIKVNLVIDARNVKETEMIVKELKRLRVHTIRYHPLKPAVRNKDCLTYILPNYTKNAQFIQCMKDIGLPSQNNDVCLAGLSWCNLDFDIHQSMYYVYGCSFVEDVYTYDLKNKYIAGSFPFDKSQKFADIWQNHDNWIPFRQQMNGQCILHKISL